MFIPLLQARGVSCFGRGGSLAFAAFAILLGFVASAKEFSVPPMPVSPYADTEVSTNIVFNASRIDVKKFELNFSFAVNSSNSIQVAFGRDENNDGVLSFSETDTVYGWRNGRYVIEDVQNAVRHEEFVTEGGRDFSINMRMTKDYTPKEFSANVGALRIFTDLASNVPSWLYRPEWNLMRVTRRGASIPGEWCRCDIGYRYFYITIR